MIPNVYTLSNSPDILLVTTMAAHFVLVIVTLLLHIYHEMLTISYAFAMNTMLA